MADSDPQLIPVCRRGKWGYIDRKGNIIIQPGYEFAGHFSEGLGLVNVGGSPGLHGLVGGNWGFIDPLGHPVIPPRFQQANDFSDGLAAVNIGAKVEYAAHEDNYYMLGGRWGFINSNGTFILQPTLEATHSFHDGLAIARLDNRFGYMDRSGEWVIFPKFDYCLPFVNGLAAAQYNRNYGYIDPSGNFRIKPRFRLAYGFSEGVAAALVGETYTWIFLDTAGNEALRAPNNVTHVGSFSGNLVMAKLGTILRMNDGNLYPGGVRKGCGFLNRQGEWAIAPEYEWAADFVEDRAWAQVEQEHYVYLRPDGSQLHTPHLTEAGNFRHGLAPAWTRGKFVLLDLDGKSVWRED